jgi:hypothetical protein
LEAVRVGGSAIGANVEAALANFVSWKVIGWAAEDILMEALAVQGAVISAE